MTKKALVFGITGQDGSYMVDLLLEKGYEVHGFRRRSATDNLSNIKHQLGNFEDHHGDLMDAGSIYRAIAKSEPDEVYNFADQDHVSWSQKMKEYSCDVTCKAPVIIMQALQQLVPKAKYLQPVTSNMYAGGEEILNENSPVNPQNPYGTMKSAAFFSTKNFRREGLFASSVIFFNHTSPRQSTEYVLRKITQTAIKIKEGLESKLVLGNIDQPIDLGFAKDYVKASWQVLQQDKPDDFMICTGSMYTIKELYAVVFDHLGLNGEEYVEPYHETFMRPTLLFRGDNSKARETFGFKPETSFEDLIKMMVDKDYEIIKKEMKNY